MNTKFNLDKILIDVTSPRTTTCTLLYSSDEPAHPVWGGGVKQKDFPASMRTDQILLAALGSSGLDYIHWPDAPADVATWFGLQPRAHQLTDWRHFDRTPPEEAPVVLAAVAAWSAGCFHGANEYRVPLELEGRKAVVKFARHDPAAPWLAMEVHRGFMAQLEVKSASRASE